MFSSKPVARCRFLKLSIRNLSLCCSCWIESGTVSLTREPMLSTEGSLTTGKITPLGLTAVKNLRSSASARCHHRAVKSLIVITLRFDERRKLFLWSRGIRSLCGHNLNGSHWQEDGRRMQRVETSTLKQIMRFAYFVSKSEASFILLCQLLRGDLIVSDLVRNRFCTNNRISVSSIHESNRMFPRRSQLRTSANCKPSTTSSVLNILYSALSHKLLCYLVHALANYMLSIRFLFSKIYFRNKCFFLKKAFVRQYESARNGWPLFGHHYS